MNFLEPKELDQAVAMLKRGEVLAFPTDTVYGIGVAYSHWEAVKRLITIKGRPINKPLIPLIETLDQARLFVDDFPPDFFTLAKAFWPGPLTIVLKKAERVPSFIVGGGATIGLRIPAHKLTLALLKEVGEPIITTSANLSGGVAPMRAEEIDPELALDGLLIDDIEVSGGASTVLSLIDTPCILREGPISLHDIQGVIQRA